MSNLNLLKLANILDKADEEHLKRSEPTYNQDRYIHPCGTPACALGHWVANNLSPDPNVGWGLLKNGYETIITYNGLVIYVTDGAMKDFGLTSYQVTELFGHHGCDHAQTGKEAALYIRRFVNTRARIKHSLFCTRGEASDVTDIDIDDGMAARTCNHCGAFVIVSTIF